MRIPMIAGNWKMNTTVSEAVALVKEMLEQLEQIKTRSRRPVPYGSGSDTISADEIESWSRRGQRRRNRS